MIIYQVFTRLFGADVEKPVKGGSRKESGCGRMADFTPKALEEIKKLGATHIWYTGIIEHATCTDYSRYGILKDNPLVVKGLAGSPYAIKDYYDVDPDLATSVPKRISEYESLIKRTHKAGLKVIQDFVPNHVARQYHSDACPEGCKDLGEGDDTTQNYSPENNFYYLGEPLHMDNIIGSNGSNVYIENPAKATGNDVFHPWPSRNDWYETVKLNYGPNTYQKMLQILLYWAAKGVDGFRCDMAEMVPVEFWQWVIPQVKAQYPEIIFIAEVYNPDQYRNYLWRGHFDYLYDKVGLYDRLKSVSAGESAKSLTGCWQSIEDIREHMLNFLENHDEQRIASDFFAGDALKGRPMVYVSMLMGTNPKMIYFGQELGEKGMDEEGFSGCDGRTTIFDYWTVDTIRRWRNGGEFGDKLLTSREKSLRKFYTEILHTAQDVKAFREGGFWDLMYVNQQLERQYAFLRSDGNESYLVVANFSDEDVTLEINIPDNALKAYNISSKKSVVRVKVKAQNGVIKALSIKHSAFSIKMNHNHLVIMAGGIGSRFWPMSTEECPKQFVDVLGCGRTFIQMTVDRFDGVVPPENVWVVTSARYRDIVHEQLPEIPTKNILLEPCRRNTAPCVAYAAWSIKARDPKAVMVVSPSDHLVLNTSEFQRVVKSSLKFAGESDAIITLGMKPTRPETGYGYIQTDLSCPSARNNEMFRVDSFKEKPDLETAKQYIQKPNMFWNAGIFIWSVNTVVNALRIYAPQINDLFESLLPIYGTEREQVEIDRIYPGCENISVDYAILEKSDEIFCFPASFGWSDLGTWGSLRENVDRDRQGNAVIGNVVTYETQNCVIHCKDERRVVVQGLDGYIVAEKDNTLLICKLSEEQRIKEFQKN